MLGLETLVEIGLQADANTFNTTQRQALNVYKISGGQTRSRPEDPILAGGFNNLSDPTEPGPGLPDHKVTIEAPLCVNQLGYWLRAFFGAPDDQGAAPDHEHLFKSGAAILPFLSIHHRLQNGDFRRHVGCIGEEFRIALDPEDDGFARVTMTFIGMEEQRGTVAAVGTVAAAPVLDRPAQALSNVSWNGVSGGQIIGGEAVFKRKLKRIRSADGTGVPSRVEYDGKSTLSGNLKLRYKDQGIIADAWSRTERAAVLELLKSATRGLSVEVSHALLDEQPISIDGPDGVEFDLPLMGYQRVVKPALSITHMSGTADYDLTLAA